MSQPRATPRLRRDLTDPQQNQQVLEQASALLAGPDHELRARLAQCNDPAFVAAADPIELEALRCALGRVHLRQCTTPFHLSVVWAMYKETARLQPRSAHAHGEDLLRVKVEQLQWLFEDAGPQQTFSLIACDDGCPETPSSAAVMAEIIEDEGYGSMVEVIELAHGLAAGDAVGLAFEQMRSTQDSRKGGSIAYAMHCAMQRDVGKARHVVLYTDADLSTNLAQAGSLLAPIVEDGRPCAIGQRYGLPGAVLVHGDTATTEPHSTGKRPSRAIVLFRHFLRASLLPQTARVLDTQAGFKAFASDVLTEVLPAMTAFNETFDVELLLRVANARGANSIGLVPITFVESYAMTNFPAGDPGQQHLDMLRQIVVLHDACADDVAPLEGDAKELLQLGRQLDLPAYDALMAYVREDLGDDLDGLFERCWPLAELTRCVRSASPA